MIYIFYLIMIVSVGSLYSMELSQEEVEHSLGNSKVFAKLLFAKSSGIPKQLDQVLANTQVNTGHAHFIYTHVDTCQLNPSKRKLSIITVHSHPRHKITDKCYRDKNSDSFFVVKVPCHLAKL